MRAREEQIFEPSVKANFYSIRAAFMNPLLFSPFRQFTIVVANIF